MSKVKELVLIGDDCEIFTGDLVETELVGDSTSTVLDLGGTKGMYVVNAIAATDTFFPAGLAIGELCPIQGTEVLASGDKIQQLDLTTVADATGWSLPITRSEIETTLLKHSFKKYRFGKKDAQGTINSMFTQGVTDTEKGLVGKTMKLVSQRGGTFEVSIPEDKSMYFLGYIRKSSVAGEIEDFIFAEINMSNVTLGGTTGNAQSYDSSFRLTGNDPVFYSLEVL